MISVPSGRQGNLSHILYQSGSSHSYARCDTDEKLLNELNYRRAYFLSESLMKTTDETKANQCQVGNETNA